MEISNIKKKVKTPLELFSIVLLGISLFSIGLIGQSVMDYSDINLEDRSEINQTPVENETSQILTNNPTANIFLLVMFIVISCLVVILIAASKLQKQKRQSSAEIKTL